MRLELRTSVGKNVESSNPIISFSGVQNWYIQIEKLSKHLPLGSFLSTLNATSLVMACFVFMETIDGYKAIDSIPYLKIPNVAARTENGEWYNFLLLGPMISLSSEVV
jgi:hypothetical protein